MNEDTTESANPNAALLADLDAKAARKARLTERIFGEPDDRLVDHDRVVGPIPSEADAE